MEGFEKTEHVLVPARPVFNYFETLKAIEVDQDPYGLLAGLVRYGQRFEGGVPDTTVCVYEPVCESVSGGLYPERLIRLLGDNTNLMLSPPQMINTVEYLLGRFSSRQSTYLNMWPLSANLVPFYLDNQLCYLYMRADWEGEVPDEEEYPKRLTISLGHSTTGGLPARSFIYAL